jgi:hypothetical protein
LTVHDELAGRLRDRQEACQDVIREAEARGEGEVARAARRLLEEAEGGWQLAEQHRRAEQQAADAKDFMRRLDLDPALLEAEQPTGGELLERYARTGDLDALSEALDTFDPAVAEQIREAAA